MLAPVQIDRDTILAVSRQPSLKVQEVMAKVTGPLVHNVVMSGSAALPEGYLWDVQRMAYPAYGKYEKKEFAPCTLACRGITCNFFKRGKVNVMGAKSVPSSVKKFYDALSYLRRRTGLRMKSRDFQLKNMQATVYLNHTIDMESLAAHIADKEYEPDNISFLKYSMEVTNGSVTFLIYKTGRIVMTKATVFAQFVEARDLFLPFVAQFALKYSPANIREEEPPVPRIRAKRKRLAAPAPTKKKKRAKRSTPKAATPSAP